MDREPGAGAMTHNIEPSRHTPELRHPTLNHLWHRLVVGIVRISGAVPLVAAQNAVLRLHQRVLAGRLSAPRRACDAR
jgi:hypothetical protein